MQIILKSPNLSERHKSSLKEVYRCLEQKVDLGNRSGKRLFSFFFLLWKCIVKIWAEHSEANFQKHIAILSCVGSAESLVSLQPLKSIHWERSNIFNSMPVVYFSSQITGSPVLFSCDGLHFLMEQWVFRHLKVRGQPRWNNPPWVMWSWPVDRLLFHGKQTAA